MMDTQIAPAQLFYDFDLERHVPSGQMLREIDRFFDVDGMREHLRPFYSHLGRPSIDPELIVRMLVVGYVRGIRSKRRLCDEVHLNLAYRWFCRLGLEGKVPDHSTFSRYRHGKFRDSNLLRQIFEATVERCLREDLVSGEGFAVDASLISADANKARSIAAEDWSPEVAREAGNRAAREYLETLDDAAFGAASPTQPKFVAKSDPAAQWTRAEESRPYFVYATNYLIDTKSSVIMDVEAARAIRQAEVGAARTMLDRTEKRFGIRPDWLAADTAYGNAENLGWLVEQRSIIPFIPVIDKSERTDGTWSRSDFEWDEANGQYICPEGRALRQYRRNYFDPNRGQDTGGRKKYRAVKATCQACPSNEICCPKAEARYVTREPHEEAREFARACRKTKAYKVSRDTRKNDLHRAYAAGFDCMIGGQAALECLFDQRLADRAPTDGPQKVFHPLHKKLGQTFLYDPDFDYFRDLIRERVLDTWPIAAGEMVLGVQLGKRRLHSIASTAGCATHCSTRPCSATWHMRGS